MNTRATKLGPLEWSSVVRLAALARALLEGAFMNIPFVPSFRRSRGVAGSFVVPLLLAATLRAEEIPPPSEAQPASAPVVIEPATRQPPPSPNPAPVPAPAVAPVSPKIILTRPEDKPECVSKDEPAEGAGMFFVGLDGRVPVGTVERGRRGFFTLGARVGALYGPPLGGWGLDEGGDATAGPGRGLTGVYGALAIGFGGGPVADRR
jgi:hypothetical protein